MPAPQERPHRAQSQPQVPTQAARKGASKAAGNATPHVATPTSKIEQRAASSSAIASSLSAAPRALQQVDLGPELKSAFHALCQREGHTPSALLRKMVRHILDNNPSADAASEPDADGRENAKPAEPTELNKTKRATDSTPLTISTARPDTGITRLELRLRDSEFAHLADRAKAGGDSVQRFIVAVVRKYLASEPVITDHELKALAESNYQLALLCNTVQQIARSLQGSSVPAMQRSQLTELTELPTTLTAHIEQVQALLSAQALRGKIEA